MPSEWIIIGATERKPDLMNAASEFLNADMSNNICDGACVIMDDLWSESQGFANATTTGCLAAMGYSASNYPDEANVIVWGRRATLRAIRN